MLREKRWITLAVVSGVICILCAGLFAGAHLWPRFSVLSVNLPTVDSVAQVWSPIEYTIQSFPNGGRYFIWRAFGRMPKEDYATKDDVLKYFEGWLFENGWVQYPSQNFSPCRNKLHEAQFLPAGEGGYMAYVGLSGDPFEPRTIVCLAIWEQIYFNELQGWNVVIQTQTPPFVARFYQELD